MAGQAPDEVSRISLHSLDEHEDYLEELRAHLEGETERVLRDAGRDLNASEQAEIRAMITDQFWASMLETIKMNVTINGQDYETAIQSAHGTVEPYDEKLNRDVFNFQDEVADAVVRNTGERRAVVQRRVHEVRTALGQTRTDDSTSANDMPSPVAQGSLPDRDETCRDFHAALGAAKSAQQNVPPDAMRLKEVQRIEMALADVTGRV